MTSVTNSAKISVVHILSIDMIITALIDDKVVSASSIVGRIMPCSLFQNAHVMFGLFSIVHSAGKQLHQNREKAKRRPLYI